MRIAACVLALFAFPANADNTLWQQYAPESGMVRVLIFGERPEDGADLGEALEDWAHYLNEFAADNADVDVRFEPHSVCRALIAHTDCGNGFATLFLNAEGEAYFYRWSIMEPQVYVHARTALQGLEIPAYAVPFASEAVALK